MASSDYTWLGGMNWWQGFMLVALVFAVIYHKRPEPDPADKKVGEQCPRGGLDGQAKTQDHLWHLWFAWGVVCWIALIIFTVEQMSVLLSTEVDPEHPHFYAQQDQEDQDGEREIHYRTVVAQPHNATIGLAILIWIIALKKGMSDRNRYISFWISLVFMVIACLLALVGATVQGNKLLVASLFIDLALLVCHLSFFCWECYLVSNFWWHVAAAVSNTVFVIVAIVFAKKDFNTDCSYQPQQALCMAGNLTRVSVMMQGLFSFTFAALILYYLVLQRGDCNKTWGRTWWLVLAMTSILSGFVGFFSFSLSFQPVGVTNDKTTSSES